eukprot:10600218-Alexandrium_andersonii.AAC.1
MGRGTPLALGRGPSRPQWGPGTLRLAPVGLSTPRYAPPGFLGLSPGCHTLWTTSPPGGCPDRCAATGRPDGTG